MAKNVLLSVDLNNCDSNQRKVFNDALAEVKIQKHKRLTTVWTARYAEGVNEADAITHTRAHVQNAATKAKIASFDVLIHVGDSAPTEYSVAPK